MNADEAPELRVAQPRAEGADPVGGVAQGAAAERRDAREGCEGRGEARVV